jgi:RNA polymerase sigma-70 factor (ECF subfamily)
MPRVSEALKAAVSPSVASELSAVDGLDEHLLRLLREGQNAHPGLVVGEGSWVAHLARHLHAEGVLSQLAELRAADVHFALACLGGQHTAQTRLHERLRSVSVQALTGIKLGTIALDDVLQDVLSKLLLAGSGEGEAKLATYAGRGPLDGWLRVTVARAALSKLRSRDPDARHSRDEADLVTLVSTDNPQLAALAARCGPEIKRAIEEAAAALPAGDRTLMRLHVLDGLTIDDLAAVYKAHRATMARRLARIRASIFEGTRVRATASLGLGEAEFESLLGVMMSRLDLTLGRILESTSRTE